MEDQEPDFLSHKYPSSIQAAEELKELWKMTLPIIGMNFLVFVRQMVSVLFLGRLGSLELAGGALSIGFTNITGYSVLVGLAAGLEPICSQAYGNKNWDLLTLSLHRMIFILFIATVPITLLWLNLNPIMTFMGQDEAITSMAAVYCLYSLPDLLTHIFLVPLKVFLRSQQVTQPLMYCTLAAVALHVPMNYVAVEVMRGGVKGVAVASVLTNFSMVVLMGGYVWVCRRGEMMTWRVRVGEVCSGSGVVALMRLAVPSCLGICLEWWWYEIVTVMAGYLVFPTVTVAATGILIQTTSMMYTVPMALAGCVSARVGNELGAGRPYKAKLAAAVAMISALLIGMINVIWTVILRDRWAALFTPDMQVQAMVASVMPILGLCELGNCPQTTAYGILRGTAKPAIGARINLVSFYLVGTPVAVGLAFGLNVGFSGLWYGLMSAQVACAVSMLYVVLVRTDWEAEALKARKLGGLEMSGSKNGLKEDQLNRYEDRRGLLTNGNSHMEEDVF